MHGVHVFHVTIHIDAVACDLLFVITMKFVEVAPSQGQDDILLSITVLAAQFQNKVKSLREGFETLYVLLMLGF